MVKRRQLLQGAAIAPFGLSALSAEVQATDSVFTDSFETTEPGAKPDGWSHYANGDQQVVDTTATDGSQSFRMAGSSGGCWEATAYHTCQIPNEGSVTISGAVKPTTEGDIGCHSRRGTVMLSTSNGDIYPENGRVILNFRTDSTVVGVQGHDLGTYTVDEWQTFEITHTRDDDTVTVSYTLNGNDHGQTSYSSKSWEDNLSYLHLQSGDIAVYWDDFEVTTGQTDDNSDDDAGGTLSYGDTVTGEITGSNPTDPEYPYFKTEPWTFQGLNGDDITVELSFEADHSPYLHVVGPDGDDVIDRRTDSQTVTLPTDGQFTIYPQAMAAQAPGEYTLTLRGNSIIDEVTPDSPYTVDINTLGASPTRALFEMTVIPKTEALNDYQSGSVSGLELQLLGTDCQIARITPLPDNDGQILQASGSILLTTASVLGGPISAAAATSYGLITSSISIAQGVQEKNLESDTGTQSALFAGGNAYSYLDSRVKYLVEIETKDGTISDVADNQIGINGWDDIPSFTYEADPKQPPSSTDQPTKYYSPNIQGNFSFAEHCE